MASSSGLSGSPGNKENAFGNSTFITNHLIYDPSYIHKYKGPTMHEMIAKLNQLTVEITDLQQVVTSLVKEGIETRTNLDELKDIVKDVIHPYLDSACSPHGITVPTIDYTPWDGSGVLEEGIDPYTCHITVTD